MGQFLGLSHSGFETLNFIEAFSKSQIVPKAMLS
jgi:hypothetical protein